MTGDEVLTELIKLLREETTDEVLFNRVAVINLAETTLKMRQGIREIADRPYLMWEEREALLALLKIEVPK